MKTLFIFKAVLVLNICIFGQWVKQTAETTASFRGLSVVNQKIVWASGTAGTVLRTINGGKDWKVLNVSGAEKLDFRDIEAFDEKTAYVLSIGEGEQSRIYKTTDGGQSWKQQFVNKDPKAFFDAIACWSSLNCIAVSDPVDGHFKLIQTLDGENWEQIKSNNLPASRDGEAAFAASGTCLIAALSGRAYLVTGGSAARVFISYDFGKNWTARETPVASGSPGMGIFSIAMLDSKNGIIVGGDYQKAEAADSNAALTTDGGKSWYPVKGLSGYRSGVVYIDRKRIIAVGSNGSDISTDGGKTWQRLGSEPLNAVNAKGPKAIWAVGPKGGIYRLKL
ncbi:MAG TPA: hypothetical protein VNK26_00270 [Pyrinomonadaceae bacterium]|nr:hypothetical protein [Pyrinomonadaceae bacterium]